MQSIYLQSTRAGLRTLFAVLLLLGSAPGANAQVERSGGGVNAQLAQQYQQAIAERTQLQADNSKLKQQLDDAKKQLQTAMQQLKAAKSGAGAGAGALQTAQTALAAAQASNQATTQSFEQLKAKSQELVTHFRETAATLKGVETERAQLQQQLAQARNSRDQCAERNLQFFQINAEVLDRYEHQGVFGRVAQVEPFTRIKRTQIENLVLEDRQRVEELRVERQKDADTASSNGSAPSGEAVAPSTKPAGK